MYSDLIFDYLENSLVEAEKDISLKKFKYGLSGDSYEITTKEESINYGKPIGLYKLLSIPNVIEMSDDVIDYTIKQIVKILKSLIGNITSKDRVLIIGLGNRHISSDSLGAKVVGKINITIESNYFPKVMAIAPSVMGLTGIETVDIVEGVISKVNPTHVIIIDSLCASSSERLGCSIQMTNTGICPGGGVGNKRKCIDEKIAKNVFSIGVPLLIYASTFIRETLEKNNVTEESINSIMQNQKNVDNSEFSKIIDNLKNIYNEDVDDMIVCIKDIEECVEILSKILASAINTLMGTEEL